MNNPSEQERRWANLRTAVDGDAEPHSKELEEIARIAMLKAMSQELKEKV